MESIYIDDDTRKEMGTAQAKRHYEQGGKFSAVMFKDEDGSERNPIGPVYAFAEGVLPFGWSRPVGGGDPEGVFYHGWSDLKWAKKLAAFLKVELIHV